MQNLPEMKSKVCTAQTLRVEDAISAKEVCDRLNFANKKVAGAYGSIIFLRMA